MGWWSASIFGGDSPLDALSDLREDIGVEIAEDEDNGYGTPDEWSESAEKAWSAKADRIAPWIRSRIQDDVRNTRQGALLFAAILANAFLVPVSRAAAAEALMPLDDFARWANETSRRHQEAGATPEQTSVDKWLTGTLEQLRARLNDLGPDLRADARDKDWNRDKDSDDDTNDDLSMFPVGDVLSLIKFPVGSADAGEFLIKAMSQAGYPDMKHPFEMGGVTAYMDDRKLIKAALPAAMEGLLKTDPDWSDHLVISVQVAVSVIMATGREMPADIREVALEAARNDPWGEDVERQRVIKAFTEAVASYQEDEPIVMGMVGLAEAFQSKNGSGMINRNTDR